MMGRLVIGATALLLCVGLTACDEKPRTKTATKTVTIEKSCDCTRPTAVEETETYYPEPPRYVRHRARTHKVHRAYKKHYAQKRRHHYAAQRDEFYADSYQGESAEIQSRSSSSSYREEHRYYKEDELTPMRQDRRYSRSYEARGEGTGDGRWVDGYGRVHYATASRYDTGPMVVNSRQGRSTWHGYGVYCRDASHHHDVDGDYYHHNDHSKVGHGFD